jgi:superfamily II DNA/RNA helicase
MCVDVAWHTGSVPQQRRRAEIMRFKQDPACRLFLSTDSGSVGLNLQAASAVVNVDLPWNPAKLEQRIARAWRKNQIRSVTVINLVCEDSIEHQILHLLASKQALADGVLDGRGDLAKLKMPSGRAAMIERMQAMMQIPPPRILSAEETVAEELRLRHGERALLIEAKTGADGRTRMLAVLDVGGEALRAETALAAARLTASPAVEVIDRANWLVLQRLAASGMIAMAEGQSRVLRHWYCDILERVATAQLS